MLRIVRLLHRTGAFVPQKQNPCYAVIIIIIIITIIIIIIY